MIDPLDVLLGGRLRQARLAKGLTRAQLATALCVSPDDVESYEGGLRRMSAACLLRACETFGVEPTFFFQGDLPSPGRSGPN